MRNPRHPPPPVTRPTSVQRRADSNPGPSKHTPSKSTAPKRMRKPSAALRESASSQKMLKRRRDPETTAMIANCDLTIEEEQEQEPPKKALKKMEMNKSFFSVLPKKVDVGGTSFSF